MLTLLAFCIAAQSQAEPIITPYFKKDPLAIRSVKPSQAEIGRYQVEEISVDLSATYDNPFDPTDISLDAKVTDPKGATYSIPGFLIGGFDRALKEGKELLTKSGDPEWRIRVCATEVGEYSVSITAKDRNGSTSSAPVLFKVKATDAHGFVRVSPRNRQYFEYSDGSSYYPIGSNICWGNDAGTFSYDQWLPAFSKQGANYTRLFLGPTWVTCGLEQTGKPEDGKGMGLIDLANSWRLEQILKKAGDNGMAVMLTIDSFNTLRAHNGYPAWDKAPQNRDNGGPIRIWTDFWTNSKIEKFYKDKLRYLVARYSAFTNVMSWEFWNEVDLTEDYPADVVQAWHQRMGEYLRQLDPYHHLVTTSIADSMGSRNLDLLPQLDYAQTHLYNNPDVAGGVVYQQSRKAEWGKPHIVAEIGADANGPRATDDPQGLQVHDPLWMSIATGCSGTAMPWWWDNLIAPNNLYPLFGAAARFTKGIDWPGEDFRRANIEFGYGQSPKTPERKDLTFENGPIQWADGDSNRPHIVSVIHGKVDGDTPLPGIQHGTRAHPSWHNPVRFRLNLDRPTKFEVLVGEVSGYGGATLQISLDGDPVMTREFATGENGIQGHSSTKFAGRYGFVVPKGEHSVVVENIGPDWFMVSYRFVNLLTRSGPALQGWGIEGNNTSLLWVRPEGRTWRKIVVDKLTIPPVAASFVLMDGLSAGDWKTEIWDTWTGSVISTTTTHVGISGKVRLSIPVVAKDLAVKLIKMNHAEQKGQK